MGGSERRLHIAAEEGAADDGDTRGIGSTGSGSRLGKRRAADSLSGRQMVPQSRDRNVRIHGRPVAHFGRSSVHTEGEE
ncbi:hypothetical protein Tco_0025956 [Tanacetum coccineum]